MTPQNLCLFLVFLVLKVNEFLFLTLQQFASVLIYTLVCLGSTRGASGCLNSPFAIGELLRGAGEFTLGGQGPLLFAWVQREPLGHPPARVHRQHISNSTVSSWNNKLPFCCQTACAHNKREKAPLRQVVTQKVVKLPHRLGCVVSEDELPTAVFCRDALLGPHRLPVSLVSKPLLLFH